MGFLDTKKPTTWSWVVATQRKTTYRDIRGLTLMTTNFTRNESIMQNQNLLILLCCCSLAGLTVIEHILRILSV